MKPGAENAVDPRRAGRFLYRTLRLPMSFREEALPQAMSRTRTGYRLRPGSCLVLSGCLLIGSVAAIPANSLDAPVSPDPYTYQTASRDGIGKWYMGREISHVMGHLGAGWLERPGRTREEGTEILVKNLPLEAGHVVADIGAGTGYFSFRIAQRIPQGRVLAVDIQREMLDLIESRRNALGIENVEAVLGTEFDPGLSDASVDLILLVDAYHEFSHPREMGLAMAKALKPGGHLILIEYRGEDPSVPIKRLHKMTEEQARREMQAIGLKWVSTGSFLPQQHFLVFERPPCNALLQPACRPIKILENHQ